MTVVLSVASRLLAVAGLLFAAGAGARELSATDRATLAQLVERTDRAWNGRDAAALASFYVAEATLRIGGRDETVDGVKAIRDYFTQSFARVDPSLRHETTLIGLHALGDDMVIADTTVELITQDAAGQRKIVRRFTTPTVAVRRGDDWKIAAVRAQVVAEPR